MKPYLNGVSGKAKSDVTTFSGGLNASTDRSFIQDNQMQYMWNVCLDKSPTLATRQSRTSLAFFIGDTTNFATGAVLKMLSLSSKSLYVIEDQRTEESPSANSHVYNYTVDSNKVLQKTYVGSVPYSSRYSMCECRDAENQYIVISTNSKRYQFVVSTSATAMETAEDDYYGLLACHKNRLWIANGTSLKFSNLREYDNFTINDEDPINTAGEINITNAKGNITSIIPYDSKLMIFCEGSRHVLYGSSPNAEIDQFSLLDFDDGIGCVSDETITICNRQLYWLDSDMSVYRYNGSYTNKVSEPYGNDNYASYGGISEIPVARTKIREFLLSSYGDLVYLIVARSSEVGVKNDTAFVYDTKNRVWWAENGEFSHLIKWETDVATPFYNRADCLIGSKYNGDIIILNSGNTMDYDTLFNLETRQFDEVPIEYAFETKTWNLGVIKQKKTLTDVWFQANAKATVSVGDYWANQSIWNATKEEYLPLGNLKALPMQHNILHPTVYNHEGMERQRFIVPRMYMQKINAFSIRVDGKGYGEFFLLEKVWRVK